MSDYHYVVDKILEGELDAAGDSLLLESEEAGIIRELGDPTLMNYLMKFEQYLDDHDVYLFDGWEDAGIPQKPTVEKFWCTFYLLVARDADMGAVARIVNDQEAQNRVQQKRVSGGVILKIRILKRTLDKMELDDQERASNLANSEMGN